MLVTGTPLPAQPPPARRAQDGSAAPQPAAPQPATPQPAADPEVAAAVARAEDAADKSRTARRDALASELTRLMEIARKLNGAGGDLRSSADALQDLARQIAKVARALADAERALPAAERRGLPPVAVPRAAAAPAEATPAEEKPAEAAPAEATATTATPAASADPDPVTTDPDDPLDPATRAEERRERARSGREGTRQLLLTAADLLDAIRKTVRKAELFEALLDPEAAKQRGKAGAEVEGLAIELRGLAARFADPAQGLGIDLTA